MSTEDDKAERDMESTLKRARAGDAKSLFVISKYLALDVSRVAASIGCWLGKCRQDIKPDTLVNKSLLVAAMQEHIDLVMKDSFLMLLARNFEQLNLNVTVTSCAPSHAVVTARTHTRLIDNLQQFAKK